MFVSHRLYLLYSDISSNFALLYSLFYHHPNKNEGGIFCEHK